MREVDVLKTRSLVTKLTELPRLFVQSYKERECWYLWCLVLRAVSWYPVSVLRCAL